LACKRQICRKYGDTKASRTNIYMIKMLSKLCCRIVQESPIGSGEVHLFCISMSQPDDCIQKFSRTLSNHEVRRRDRLHFAKDRDRYIVRHGALREIVGCYLSIPAHDIDIEYTKYGKPVIIENSFGSRLQFNLSSSNDLALIAVTRMNHVGVDIEYISDDFHWRDIALKYFSSGEIEQLFSLPEKLRKRGFFDCWTRKEAYVKARGEGLSYPLDRFEVSMCPGDRAQLLHHYDDPHEAFRWTLQGIDLGNRYAAAFAVGGQISEYRLWDFR
jgi:4'-phosphopantetheinyl transferase